MKLNRLSGIAIFCFAGLLLFLYSCLHRQPEGERVARQYCGSCHLFPEPSLLDKNAWETGVLPEMAFRMGIEYSKLSTLSSDDQREVMLTLPQKPMVKEEEWELIKQYYLTNAPDSLSVPKLPATKTITQFDWEPHAFSFFPLTTFVTADTLRHKIYIGSRLSKLYQLSENFIREDSLDLTSPPSQMRFGKDGDITLLLMGVMDPNDQAKGSLANLRSTDKKISTVLDSLKRPVFFQPADLNNDGLEDIVVCAFGNYSGALLAYKNVGNGNYEKLVFQNLPGARKVVIRDFDDNGLQDIVVLMSQGDEKIMLLLNQGNFDFRINTLLRFPPVYGSSFFDIADFNKDGKFDILYSNGDNADYSTILKPYHGVRIFLNDGKNGFNESWFYNMHGASQAIARDFDLDGDLDIAAISFFPDFNDSPEQGFIYFEKTDKGFIPQTIPLGAAGRWLTIEAADTDDDGDCDLLLGALDFASKVPTPLLDRWKTERTSILFLRNKAK